MPASLPLLLVPGLACTARLYAPQVTALWPSAPLMIADHRKDDHIDAVARRILDNAPPRFALAGLSMGGYIAFAMMRLAPERIARLALFDTSAWADTAEQTAARQSQIAMTKAGRYGEIADLSMPRYVHPDRQNDAAITGAVRQMSAETGPEAFIRQLKAIMSRPDSRSMLGSIHCPTLVLVGDADLATPPDLSQEIADGIAGAKLVVVPNCAHLSTLEQPEPVNAALIEWLSEE
ncbi:MAG TPA: alpha/beta fold hydrolase [Pseudolabrys sp.]